MKALSISVILAIGVINQNHNERNLSAALPKAINTNIIVMDSMKYEYFRNIFTKKLLRGLLNFVNRINSN